MGATNISAYVISSRELERDYFWRKYENETGGHGNFEKILASMYGFLSRRR